MILALLLSLLVVSCATTVADSENGADAQPSAPTFVVVRHAEKTDNSKNPALSEQGRQRAHALAERLANERVIAAYATQYRRTAQTAQPTARDHALTISSYDARIPAAELATSLRRAYADGGEVLIVGHSDTVPGIVAALCECEVAPIDDGDYGNLYRIDSGTDGKPRLRHERY